MKSFTKKQSWSFRNFLYADDFQSCLFLFSVFRIEFKIKSYPILVVKNLPASAGDIRDTGLIPGSGRSPGEGNGNLLQYSWLGNPMNTGVWQATVYGVAKLDTTEHAYRSPNI